MSQLGATREPPPTISAPSAAGPSGPVSALS